MKRATSHILVALAMAQLAFFAISCPAHAKTAGQSRAHASQIAANPVAKILARLDPLNPKINAVQKRYDKLDYQIKSMEKKWLGVGIPSGLSAKYEGLRADRNNMLLQLEDLRDQTFGVFIQLGDHYRETKQYALAEQNYIFVMERRSPTPLRELSNAAYQKAVGRLVSMYSEFARSSAASHDTFSARHYWAGVVSLLGNGDARCAEANAGLVACNQEDARIEEMRDAIREPSIAGLKIGDPVTRADELYGTVYAAGSQIYKTETAATTSVPERVYYSKEDGAWLVIFSFSDGKKITDVLITKDLRADNEFTKDCGRSFLRSATARGVKVGDSIHQAISLYGDHERPTGSTLHYSTGDHYVLTDEGVSAGSLCFGYDAKTKAIRWIMVGSRMPGG